MMTTTFYRRETGLLEQMCEHGIGHPTQASAKEIAKQYKHHVKVWMAHGCDGCCQKGMDHKKK